MTIEELLNKIDDDLMAARVELDEIRAMLRSGSPFPVRQAREFRRRLAITAFNFDLALHHTGSDN